jgi:hypothetical protein
MHSVTRRSLKMEKHKLSARCPDVLFMETTSGPREHEKYCVDGSCPGHTGMHYVIHRSHRMQIHKFGVMCPSVLFVKSDSVISKHEKSALMFGVPHAMECST